MEFLAAVLAIVALVFVVKTRKRVTELEQRIADLDQQIFRGHPATQASHVSETPPELPFEMPEVRPEAYTPVESTSVLATAVSVLSRTPSPTSSGSS